MSLRERLRRDTRAAHDVVDTSFEQFDLSGAHGYHAFLECHWRALRQLLAACGPKSRAAGDIQTMLARLDADLAVMGRSPLQSPPPSSRRLHPVSMEYVLLGSHMGMRTLHKRWMNTRHPTTAGASAFLSTPMEPSRWKTFCATLSGLPEVGDAADTIVADALSVFSTYTQVARGLSLSDAGG